MPEQMALFSAVVLIATSGSGFTVKIIVTTESQPLTAWSVVVFSPAAVNTLSFQV